MQLVYAQQASLFGHKSTSWAQKHNNYYTTMDCIVTRVYVTIIDYGIYM